MLKTRINKGKTRINKGKTRMNKRKTRISAGFSLAEMEGFEPSRHFRTLLP